MFAVRYMNVIAILTVWSFLLLSGCSDKVSSSPDPDDKDDVPVSEYNSTWEAIQTVVFDANCVDCHYEGGSFANQSGLVLTSDVAYEQLIDVEPKNAAARDADLLRVGSEGLASLHKSFLWEKINAPNQAHFYSTHPTYGALMPLGKPPLTNGEIQLIEDWILAGAPADGHVVDLAVLEDDTRYEPSEFVALDLPESGMQFHLEPFEIWPNNEREFFYYVPVQNNEDLFVNRTEISMRSGSHHFIAYRFTSDQYLPEPEVIRDLRDENGNYDATVLVFQLFHEFFAGTQWPLMNYQFPQGVALRLPANSHFDLNPHYVNQTAEATQGEIYMNLHTVEPEEVEHIAEILTISKFTFELPPNQITTLTETKTFNQRSHIFQLFSHAHQHMLEFKVFIEGGDRDGELIYIAYDWEHPPILDYDPPIVLEPGQKLRLETTYNNWRDVPLSFGFLSTDEMMILFGAYYTD